MQAVMAETAWPERGSTYLIIASFQAAWAGLAALAETAGLAVRAEMEVRAVMAAAGGMAIMAVSVGLAVMVVMSIADHRVAMEALAAAAALAVPPFRARTFGCVTLA